jgi:hypothetical protein
MLAAACVVPQEALLAWCVARVLRIEDAAQMKEIASVRPAAGPVS